jgi:hypothetical protein
MEEDLLTVWDESLVGNIRPSASVFSVMPRAESHLFYVYLGGE